MSGQGALRVVQLNMGSLFEPDWDRRRHEVLAWFDRLQPDIVCLQEAWEDASHSNTAGWLVEHSSTDWHWCFGGYPAPEPLWPDPGLQFGSAILSRRPVDKHELIALPVDDTAPDPRWHFQSELLYARSAGVDIYSTHLVPVPAQAYHRVKQVMFIDEAIKARSNGRASMPPVLCGDFNAEPLSDEIRFLGANAVVEGRSAYYIDAWLAAGHADPGITADPRTNPACAAINVPPKRIDYVFVGDTFGRRNSAGMVLSAELCFHFPMTGILASDHFGLVVDLCWPEL